MLQIQLVPVDNKITDYIQCQSMRQVVAHKEQKYYSVHQSPLEDLLIALPIHQPMKNKADTTVKWTYRSN